LISGKSSWNWLVVLICSVGALFVFYSNYTDITFSQSLNSTLPLAKYTDPESLFTIDYPQGWIRDYSKTNETIQLKLNPPDGSSLVQIGIGKSTKFNSTVELKESFQEMVADAPSGLASSIGINSSDVKVLQSEFGKYQIDGQDAGFMLVKMHTPPNERKTAFFTAQVGDKSVLFQFITNENLFDGMFQTVEQMVKSLKIQS
jgi:hypothetical protein